MAALLHVLVGALVIAVSAMDIPRDIMIDSSATCGELFYVSQEGEFRLFATGNSPASDCSFTFKADQIPESTCSPGLCYMFDTYANLKTSQVTLSIEAGINAMVYVNRTRLPQGPVCSENEDTLKIILSQDHDYVYNADDPDYTFRLSIYHHCGQKGQVKNVKFEDVVHLATGYHRGDQKDTNVKNHIIYGLIVALCLACSFLVVFAIAYCYMRSSPNRGHRLSVAAVEYSYPRKPMKRNVETGAKFKKGIHRVSDSNVLLTPHKRT